MVYFRAPSQWMITGGTYEKPQVIESPRMTWGSLISSSDSVLLLWHGDWWELQLGGKSTNIVYSGEHRRTCAWTREQDDISYTFLSFEWPGSPQQYVPLNKKNMYSQWTLIWWQTSIVNMSSNCEELGRAAAMAIYWLQTAYFLSMGVVLTTVFWGHSSMNFTAFERSKPRSPSKDDPIRWCRCCVVPFVTVKGTAVPFFS